MVVKLKQGTQIKLDLPGLHHLMRLYPVTATPPYFIVESRKVVPTSSSKVSQCRAG